MDFPKVTLVIGSLLAIAGAVCFFALFGQAQSDAIRALGSALFSVGILTVASGLYLQARKIQAKFEASAPKSKTTDRLCSSCNREPSVVFCRVHVLRLCLNCLDKHDDGANCSYVPAKRATAAYR